jgi:Zn2+/Cd2+-exporting ATPase
VLDGPERTMLGLAAAVESGSSHPLGRAILERAAVDGIPLRSVKDSRAIPGSAVEAVPAKFVQCWSKAPYVSPAKG